MRGASKKNGNIENKGKYINKIEMEFISIKWKVSVVSFVLQL